MTELWLSNVNHTYEIGSQRGAQYNEDCRSFDQVVNAFLNLGWRIINTYVEGKEPGSTREECVCLLGWSGGSAPIYPDNYGPK